MQLASDEARSNIASIHATCLQRGTLLAMPATRDSYSSLSPARWSLSLSMPLSCPPAPCSCPPVSHARWSLSLSLAPLSCTHQAIPLSVSHACQSLSRACRSFPLSCAGPSPCPPVHPLHASPSLSPASPLSLVPPSPAYQSFTLAHLSLSVPRPPVPLSRLPVLPSLARSPRPPVHPSHAGPSLSPASPSLSPASPLSLVPPSPACRSFTLAHWSLYVPRPPVPLSRPVVPLSGASLVPTRPSPSRLPVSLSRARLPLARSLSLGWRVDHRYTGPVTRTCTRRD